MAITALISSAVYNVKEGSLKVKRTIDGRSTCSCTIEDLTGLEHFIEGQRVTILDDIKGAMFDGVIEASGENNLYPNAAMESTLTIGDDKFLANKRYYSGIEYKSRYAGDIAIDLLTNALAGEGITASYASRNDQTKGNWQDGTLSNVVAGDTLSGGDLELAPAGSAVIYAEPDNNNFTTGSLVNVTGTSTLQPTSTPAIKLQAQMSVPGATSAYTWVKVWSGTSTALATNPHLQYQVYVDPASPEAKFAIDLVFSDGKKWSDTWSFYTDGENLSPLVSTDLTGLATTGWYSRDLFLGDYIGKSIVAVMVGCGGLKTGSYTGWFKDMLVIDNSHTTNFSLNVNPPQQLQSFGYSATSVSQVAAYDIYTSTGPAYGSPSFRDTLSISIDSVNILKSSFISWSADVPEKTAFVMKYSIDGASYIPCTNNAALPYLLAGTSLSGKSITFEMQFYALPGASPEVCPVLKNWSVQFQPSYVATKNDVIYSIVNASDWTGGTFTNLINQNRVLTLNGAIRNFDDGSTNNTTLYTTNAQQIVNNRSLQLNVTNGVDARARMDFAGQYQNFTAEMDVKVDVFQSGFVYRCTNWQNNNNTFAYSVMMTTTQVQLGRGTNSTSGSGSFTSISTATLALTAGDWHRLKIVINGSNHKVYIDDILFINATDSTYSAAGYIGIRCNNTTASGCSALFDNFGVVAALSGTWISPNISLTGAGSYGNSVIFWRDRTPSFNGATNTNTLIEASINGGTTWLSCTNGAALSNFTAGLSLSGVNLKLRVTLTTSTASSMPALDNLTVKILGAFNSTGYRISPALQLGSVGRAGSTLVSWSGVQAPGTTIAVDTTPDLSVYTQIGTGAESSGAIAGINTQPEPTIDEFDTDSSRNYTSTSNSSGAVASWSWNTASSRLEVSGGSLALLIFNSPVVGADVDVQAIMDTADNGGFCWRYQGDQKNYYECVIHDASAVNGPNTIQLFKSVAGTRTQIGAAASIDFTRGTPHVIRANMIGSAITLYFDGTSVLTASDSSITAAGYCGLRNNTNSGSSATFYQFRVQAYGDDLTGKQVFTRVRLTSTDPTVSPLVDQLSISARNANIQNGAFIPGPTKYSVLNGATNAIDKVFDDLCKQSGNYWWKFIDGQFYFQGYQTIPAPFAISNKDILVSNAKIENSNDVYRNSQWLQGGIDVIPQVETLTGDNNKKTFTLKYAIDSITSITYNNTALTIGINGADTGKDWYYKQGEKELNQDDSASALTTIQSITVAYNAQIPITVNIKRDDEIARRAALDLSTGIIEEVENVAGLTKKQIIVSGDGKLTQYAVKGKKATFRTLRPGLDVGQLVCMFLSPFGISDGTFLITDIQVSWRSTAQYGIQEVYDVTAIQGPIIGDYARFIDNLTV